MELTLEAHNTSCAIQDLLEEQTPHYIDWIARLVRPYLGRRLLDVGCSTGNLTRQMLDRELVIGVEPNPIAIARARAGWGSSANVLLYEMPVPNPAFAELAAHRPDSCMCLNVLEHVEDDVLALRQIHDVLTPGGTFFLLVPAHRWLYGSMDAADHHYRRYERADLRRKLGASGFQLRDMWSFNLPGVLGWLVNGRVLKRGLIPAKQAGLYDRVIPFIERLERLARPPIGQSIVAVATAV